MSRDGYLPPGIEYADLPGVYDDDENPECECGHPQDQHDDGHKQCANPDCFCINFTPADAY